MKKIFAAVDTFFSQTLWQIETAGLRKAHRFLVTATRLGYKLQDDFRRGEFSVRASSLVYTTLLTFVPLLAIAFALLKALGVHTMIAPFLLNFLSPIGEKSKEITDTIVNYVNKINVNVLGTVGLAFLLYTVISTVQQIESAFNHFWQITKARDLFRKFRDYLSVLLVGPLLIAASLGITTTIMSHKVVQTLKGFEPFGTGIIIFGKLFPYFLIIFSFTMIYYLLPNTKVRLRSALAGGVFSGILWEFLSWGFAKFLVSTAQFSAIYSGFAIVLVFMLWLYFNWLIMLIGVKVAFYHQFPAMLRTRRDLDVFSERFRYRLALVIMYLIGLHYYNDMPRWTLNSLIRHLGLPVNAVLEVLQALESRKLLLPIKEDMSYVPGRDLETITVREVISAVAHHLRGDERFSYSACSTPVIDRMIGRLDECIDQGLKEETMKSLIFAPDAVACELKQDRAAKKK